MYECNMLSKHCANCPIRRAGIAKPQSIFARIHRWHSQWWPGWKSYQAIRRLGQKVSQAEA